MTYQPKRVRKSTAIQKSTHVVLDEYELGRRKAMLITPADKISSLNRQGIVLLQQTLGHGSSLGQWEIPPTAVPGMQIRPRVVDLRSRIVHFLPSPFRDFYRECERLRESANSLLDGEPGDLLDQAVLIASRYLVLLRMGPSRFGRRGRSAPLSPRNIHRIAYTALAKILAAAMSRHLRFAAQNVLSDGLENSLRLSRLCQEDWSDLNNSAGDVDNEVKRLSYLQEQGLWNDAPEVVTSVLHSVTSVSGSAKPAAKKRFIDVHLALPDEYISALGQRSCWIIKNLAPNIELICREIGEIWRDTATQQESIAKIRGRRQIALSALLKNFVWKDAYGAPFLCPAFPIPLPRRKFGQGDWPPKNYLQIIHLARLVQDAHIFIIGMSTGARNSEIVSLNRDCLVYGLEEKPEAKGRTFKLVCRFDGAMRKWVLPDIAAEAILSQLRLLDVIEKISPLSGKFAQVVRAESPNSHLWASIGCNPKGDSARYNQERVGNATLRLQEYVYNIGLPVVTNGQKIRIHRLRKTVARLVALALTQAPKILMDVFGHRSIEMTIYYILTDRELRLEIEQVNRELRVMRAKEVIDNIVAAEDSPTPGGYGGPASYLIEKAIENHEQRLHRNGKEWGTTSAIELAEVLTLQGKAWQFVRPGVICTKFPGTERGPCNMSRGHPEPSRCQSQCAHRLEEAFLRTDVDAILEFSIKNFESSSDDELLKAHWAGQIRANINRFPDLYEKWSSRPEMKSIMVSAKSFNSL
jgi:integrase